MQIGEDQSRCPVCKAAAPMPESPGDDVPKSARFVLMELLGLAARLIQAKQIGSA
jgi:hypothetical protein